jgi:hypothetical protein
MRAATRDFARMWEKHLGFMLNGEIYEHISFMP